MKRRIALATLLLLATGCGHTETSLLLLDKLPDVKSIHLHGNKAFSEGTLKSLMVLSEGQWWNPLKDQALVFYEIALGHRDVLRDLTVSGNQRLNQHAVRREISSEEGEVLERKELLKSQTRLLESGYFYDARWDTTRLDTLAHHVD